MNILSYVHLRNLVRSTGAGRVARSIIESYATLGGDELRILADRSDHNRIVPQLTHPWDKFQYHLFESETSVQQRNWFLFGTPVAESFWPEVDLVYCTGESYVPTNRTKSVVLIHDMAFFDEGAHLKTWTNIAQRFKWSILFQKLSQKASYIQTVSEFSAERLRHHFPRLRERIRVIHNGVTNNFFSTDIDEEMETEHLSKFCLRGKKYILVPRGLSYRKNADLILKCLPLLIENNPEILLVVTSHNDQGYVQKAMQFAKNIVLPGFVTDDELRTLYRNATVVWFPSKYEGFGLPVLESMACGTPVVTSDAAALPEVVGDAGIVVPVDDYSKHFDSLIYLLNSEQGRKLLSDKGKTRAQAFTWLRAATKLQAVFRECN
jgi:glycosyltransferase involved in cell wall biosynthesis